MSHIPRNSSKVVMISLNLNFLDYLCTVRLVGQELRTHPVGCPHLDTVTGKPIAHWLGSNLYAIQQLLPLAQIQPAQF
jgi:hypothetical protein